MGALSPIVIWIAKAVAEWAIGKLAKHLGYDNAVVHIQAVLENARPLKPEENPPPKQSEGSIEKHYGG